MTSRTEAVRILERRLSALEERISDKEGRAEWRGLSYDRQEAAAIRVALRELVARSMETHDQ